MSINSYFKMLDCQLFQDGGLTVYSCRRIVSACMMTLWFFSVIWVHISFLFKNSSIPEISRKIVFCQIFCMYTNKVYNTNFSGHAKMKKTEEINFKFGYFQIFRSRLKKRLIKTIIFLLFVFIIFNLFSFVAHFKN